ncbi:MAG TPA: DUF5818 domain-containing protein [Gemmatimonadales bacterium]|nr:DUF5818 domain-containing protein [Gemmatimonadales bacterium]
MFGTSKALLAAAVVALAGAFAPATATAQEPTTVTGCLSKGEGDGSFSIKDEGGKTYWLTGTAVKLDGHVGHKVTITGTPAQVETGAVAVKDTAAAPAGETAAAPHDTSMKHHEDMGKETGKADAAAAGGGTLTVTDMKMVSGTCS